MKKEKYISELKLKFESYSPISKESWELIESIITFQKLEKDEFLLRNGQTAKKVHFVCKGALRAFVTDYNGNTSQLSESLVLEEGLECCNLVF